MARKKRPGRPTTFKDDSVLGAEFAAKKAHADALWREQQEQTARTEANKAARASLRRSNPRWKGGPSTARQLIVDRRRSDRWRYAGLDVQGPPTYETIRDDILMVARNPTVSADQLYKQILGVLNHAANNGTPKQRRRHKKLIEEALSSLWTDARRDQQILRESTSAEPPNTSRETAVYSLGRSELSELERLLAEGSPEEEQEALARIVGSREPARVVNRVEGPTTELQCPPDRLQILIDCIARLDANGLIPE